MGNLPALGHGKCALCLAVTCVCVCVCVADMPSGSELCQRGGSEAFQHQRERVGGPKTAENW